MNRPSDVRMHEAGLGKGVLNGNICAGLMGRTGVA